MVKLVGKMKRSTLKKILVLANVFGAALIIIVVL